MPVCHHNISCKRTFELSIKYLILSQRMSQASCHFVTSHKKSDGSLSIKSFPIFNPLNFFLKLEYLQQINSG